MARPPKKGLEYFPLDVTPDDKIDLIEAKHGLIGFAVVIKLWAKCYANSYYYEWTKKEQLLFSNKCKVDLEKVNEIIEDCFEWGLLDKGLYDKFQILTSRGIQRRYIKAADRRTEIIIEKEHILLSENEVNKLNNLVIVDRNPVNAYRNPVIVDDNPHSCVVSDDRKTQSKVKESKVKKSISECTREQQDSFMNFIAWIDENAPFVNEMQKPFEIHQYMKIVEKYPKELIQKVLLAMDNNQSYIKKRKYVSAYSTFINWADREPVKTVDKTAQKLLKNL